MPDGRAPKELERLAALKRYDILDTPAEESFDRITRVARAALDVPIVLISLVDADRQWFKSRQGLLATETPRNVSFCAHAIQQNEPLVIENALEDERFRDNSLVTGEPNIRFYAGTPLRTPDGFNVGTLCAIDREPRSLSASQMGILRDLSQLVVDQMELRLIASTDSLTGAQTRRSFSIYLEQEIERAQRYRRVASFIMFDIDHFKSINDSFGHAAGDFVLQTLTEHSRALLRSVDNLARLGGEEFAIVLPETDSRGGMAAAERLRTQIADSPLRFGEQEIQVTASFGVTTLVAEQDTVASLLGRADKALYQAKKDGRNRTVYLAAAAPA